MTAKKHPDFLYAEEVGETTQGLLSVDW
jgi:hypothetical protein